MKRILSLLLAVPLIALPAPARAADGGTLSLLTYNVAGLPEALSSATTPRSASTKTIGARLGAYDVVNVQEDFNYHADLYSTDTHAYRTPTSGGVPFGDGLNTLAKYPYSDLVRVKWNSCNGTDCLTPKGFTFKRLRLAEGIYLDLYNAHPNAGTADADLSARRSNITQLSQYVAANSAGNAVIVAGDTNTRYTRAGDNIRDLVNANGLTDAWVQQERGGVPPAAGSDALVCDPAHLTNSCEVVDKILYRGSSLLRLRLDSFNNENAAFLTDAGEMLSDHYPHAARFTWTLGTGIRASDQFGGPHGTPFTDLASVGSPVRTVSFRGGSRVDQVGVTLANGTALTHGGTGGSPVSLTLATGEYLTQVTLSSGQKDGETRIFSVQVRTNLGRELSVGTSTTTQVTYTAPAGWKIAGFHGRSGAEIDKLGVLYTPA